MLVFTGDICLCDKAFDIGFGVGSQIAKRKVHPFAFLNRQEDEIWVGNFEGVLSDVTNRTDYTKDSFRIDSETFGKCGSIIDYWGIANNHVMEHGSEAYLQMEAILNVKSKGVFGSNKHRSIRFEHQGKTVAITGFSLRVEEGKEEPLYWHLPELSAFQKEYQQIADADFKVVYIHWGCEYVDYPSVEQQRLAHWLVDMGYDLVIGMHPHILQGYEIYKGKNIFYSLGNFIFNKQYEPSLYGAIVKVDIAKREVGYQCVKIDKNSSPHYINEEDMPKRYRLLELNAKIGIQQNPEKYNSSFIRGLKAYRKSNNLDIIKNLFKFNPKIFANIFVGFIKRKISSPGPTCR